MFFSLFCLSTLLHVFLATCLFGSVLIYFLFQLPDVLHPCLHIRSCLSQCDYWSVLFAPCLPPKLLPCVMPHHSRNKGTLLIIPASCLLFCVWVLKTLQNTSEQFWTQQNSQEWTLLETFCPEAEKTRLLEEAHRWG